jgi:aminoglycoside phosphotransferase (APT) family kinase protein
MTRPVAGRSGLPDRVAGWVEERCGQITAVRRLPGATTAAVDAVDAGGERLVLKRFVHRFLSDEEPGWAVHEATVLRFLAGTDVPAPRLVSVDADGSRCGAPTVLMTRLSGAPAVPNPNPRATAELLVRIHALSGDVPYTFRRYQEGVDASVPPSWTGQPGLWERAVAVAAGPGPGSTEGFIHRDANDGNMLWQGEAVSGVVDWLSACRGPLGIDVARVRLDMTLRGERVGAAGVLEAYVGAGVVEAYHPHWDVVDALDLIPWYRGPSGVDRWPGTPDAPRRRARLERFLAEALAALG